METPASLRWALAWAVLTGRFFSISVIANESGTAYTFVVGPDSVRAWLKRRDEAKAKRLAEREADRG